MDPEQIKLLTEEIQRLQRTLEEGFLKSKEAATKAKEEGQKAIKDLGDSWTRELDDAGETFIDVSRTWGEAIEESLTTAVKAPFSLIESTLRTYKEEIQYLAKSFDASALRGRDKAGGLFEGLQRLNQTVFAGLPFGGLLGVMLFGRMQQAQWFSQAQQAGQVMQRSGGIGRRVLQQLQGDLRTLEQSIPGIAGNFQAAGGALAEMGFTGREAAGAVRQGLQGARDTVLNLSVAMDRFFEVGQGESMRFAATIAQNTNSALKESVALVRDIGMAVQDTGISFNVMLGSVMQVTSAMRLQTNELREAKSVAEAIQQAQAGFRSEGVSAQRAGAIAVAGLQGVAGALSNMQVGLKAVMGERLSDGRERGLDAIMRFEQGFRGQGNEQQFFQRSIEEILKLSNELGKGDPARQYQVLKSLFGMNAEQAQTLLAIQRAEQDGLPIDKASAQHMDALNRAFRDEGLKQSTFRTMMNRLIQVVAKVGGSLLDVIVSGLEMLVASIVYLTKYLTSSVSSKQEAAFDRYMITSGARTGRAFQTAFDQLTESADIAKMFGDTILGRTNRENRAASQFYAEMAGPVGEPKPTTSVWSSKPTPRRSTWGTAESRRAARRNRGASTTFDVDVELDIPPGGGRTRMTGSMRPVAVPSTEW